MLRKKYVILVMVLIFGITSFWHTRTGAQQPSSSLSNELVLNRASGIAGIPPGSLKIADRVTRNFKLTAVRIELAKVLDPATGSTYLVALDAQGSPTDLAAAEAAEERARVAKFQKTDPRLFDKLPGVGNNAIPVSIWLNVPDPRLPRSITTTPEDAQAALSAHLQALEAYMAAKRQGVLDTLARMKVPGHAPRYAPAVFANLTRGQIEAIARHPDVGTVYGPEEYTRFEDDASTTERTYRVWAAGNLGAGTSSRPVIHEDDGIADFNQFLNNLTHPVIYWCSSPNASCSVGKNIGDHASEVGGIIASTHPLFRGIAPSSQILLSANFQSFSSPGFDQRTVDAFEWARGNGGDPTNMSWGTNCGGFQTFSSRYVDFATRHLFATTVISAGNTGFACGPSTTDDQKVSSPGLAWTAITVGSQFDNNDGFWSGDGMSTFSRFINPDFATGMEKPEVVAVGQDVRTTDAQGGDGLTASGVNGTSFSSPNVAGQVVQLLSRRPGQNQWPETNKAAVLVSAYHDIVGGTSQDGVGAVVMNNSDDTYRLGRFVDDSNAGSLLGVSDFDRNYPVALTSGQLVRVAIAWDSDSTGGGGTDVLGADIDLQILKPDGSFLTSSASVDNAWEMVEFTPPVSGTYTFRAHLFTNEVGWPGTFLGMAYSIRSLPNFCTGVGSGAGTISVNTANGPTWFDSYTGWGFDQSGREFIRKIVLSTTKDINVTDTNANLDLHVIQISSCSADPIVPTVIANGFDSIFVDNAPAGTYYVVVDGFSGFVGTTNLTISLTGP